MRGGEKVVESLCEMFPEADIFTLVLDERRISKALKTHRIVTSFIQKIPGGRRFYRQLLPLMPFALEQFDLTGYDLIISSESGPAKGIVPGPGSVHICYCHSPMRYIWDHYHVYLHETGWVGRTAMAVFAPMLRAWDVTTASRVDHFVANSHHVAKRIQRFYGRGSTVINPPVAVEDFCATQPAGDFYLCAGHLVGYKRVDLAIETFNQMDRPLVVIGGGPQFKALQKIAGPKTKLMGAQEFPVLKDYMERCRALVFPGEEDFGIVPVEAMACGRPVIVFNRGGARETVSSDAVGVKFDIQSVESLVTAVRRFEAVEHTFDTLAIRKHAEKFNKSVFQTRLRALIDREMAAKGEAPARRRKSHSPTTASLPTWSRPKDALRPRAWGE
ncbi:glycosyl transferase [Sinorhizobium fredii]|uniref:Glycosyl transferase n=1 Tax=Rhizobium fredii TaxID=380 RepID=A0A2A6M705_RHIFR|nr:glycosyltransferase [Sinorhizobium fredii]PDT50435.1 glycosyl transferase [Sinorhizobium fredii]